MSRTFAWRPARLAPIALGLGTNPEMCERIIRRTCQRPLGLFEDADFAASCETIAAPTP